MHKPKYEKKFYPKKPSTFKPNRQYIESALTDYLNRGGKITKLGKQSDYYSSMTNTSKYQDAYTGKIY